MAPGPETYRRIALDAVPRLLNLLDRNPASGSFGCFDRDYWLHRQKDFANAAAQMSVWSLALLYRGSFAGNVFFNDPGVRGWVEAGIRFALKIQHRDGSFDEWYPNERGWAGPTGYLAHALFMTLKIMDGDLPAELRDETKAALIRAARFLADNHEHETLANHFAIALVPLTEVAREWPETDLGPAARRMLERFKGLWSGEGWSLEYDGCDLGYALGTLAFLADLPGVTEDPALMGRISKSCVFLSHFAYPDGTWAGALGSRHTSHSYPHALEFWAKLLPESRALLGHQRWATSGGLSPRPQDQEDHYLHYRLHEYLRAADAFAADVAGARLPYETEGFTDVTFPEAGFRIERKGPLVLWWAFRRGGVVRLFDLEKGLLLFADNGVTFTARRRSFTSLWQGSSETRYGLCEGSLHPYFNRRFRPWSFLLFRLACLVMANARAASWFKLRIRRMMITIRSPSLSRWRRELEWSENELILRDRVLWKEPARWRSLFAGGEFHARMVPQGVYASAAERKFAPGVFAPADVKDSGDIEIETRFDPKTGETRRCAR